MDLRGKVAWITGGARIGSGVARALIENGCRVVATYRRSKEAADDVAQAARERGMEADAFSVDVTKPADVVSAVKRIETRFGRLDVLINMASIYQRTPFDDVNETAWRENIDANLTSAFLTVRHAAPLLRREGGRVINFSDWVAASGRPRYRDFLPYYAAKSGVLGLTEAQALELAPSVLVNAIAPGPILPPENLTTEETADIAAVTPAARWGGADEIVKAVLFLIESDFVTGECIRVDGGRHLL